MHEIEPAEIEGHACLALRSGEGLVARFAPGAGMVCASLEYRGDELLAGGEGLDAYARRGRLFGIPLLHPWANRLARHGFSFGGIDVAFPEDDRHWARDPNGLPIHGLLSGCADWRVREQAADRAAARIVAELDFAADPDRLALFPFSHRLRIEARLSGSALTITTTLEASGQRAVPVAFGWHPYFALPGLARAEWGVSLPVGRQYVLDARCLPTGERRAVEIPDGPLGERRYDDLFDQLTPGKPFVVEGGSRRIEVHYGEGYDVAVVYAPAARDLICFEPMTAPTDPFSGVAALRSVAPGERFSATFEVRVGSTG